MLDKLKSGFDPGAFLQGLILTALLYTVLFAVIWFKGPETMSKMSDQLASKTVTITRDSSSPLPLEPIDTVDLDEPREAEDRSLATAPIDGLYEWNELGRLPVARPKDKLTSFKAYKRPYSYSGKPIIALLIKDFGLSDNTSSKALEQLPADVTMLLSPYSTEPERWSTAARNDGHEVWLNVSFETARYPLSDPGSQALLAGQSLKYNQDRLIWNLSRTTGYAGIAGATDYVFDSASAILQPLMKMAFIRGLAFLELNPEASSLIETTAITADAAYVRADVLINDQNTEASTGSPLKNLERIATQKGYALGVLTPYDASIDQIKTWIRSLAAKGYALAPASAVAELQMKHAGPKNQ